MTRRIAAGLAALTLMGASGSLTAQDSLDRRDPAAALSAQFLAAAAEARLMAGTPNGHHRALDPLVGEWLTEVRVWSEGSEEPTVTRGSATYRWVMDGRFLLEETSTKLGSGLHEGMALIGFNNVTGEYEAARIDNQNTSMFFLAGTMNPSGDISWRSQYREPISGKWTEVLTLQTMLDVNEMKIETFEGTVGPDRKVMEVIATRVSG